MRFYTEEVSTVLSDVKSTFRGLSKEQAEMRLEKEGKNKLKAPPKISLFRRFMEQLANPMIIILIIAAIISGVTSWYSGESLTDVFIIMIVVIINAVLGVYQENKAEAAIEALQKMTAATSKVLRDGDIDIIPSEDLVVGDVILLEAGDAVPADARLLSSASLKAEEAALTGESVPVNKFIDIINLKDNSEIPLGDRKNMVYMGSTIVYGHGEAVIIATGMNTEMGKIADALNKAEDELTPLQRKLNELSKILTWLVLGICAVIFAVSLLEAKELNGDVILDTFMVAVSLAVAAIPEGLAAVVTIVLSIGVTNMSKRNAVIRRLTAVETLGSAQIICSDKTGTLTQNKMTVVDAYTTNQELLAKAMALCNDAEINASGLIQGEPTEAALVSYGNSLGLNKNALKESYLRVGEAPFDSFRKMMSTVHADGDTFIQFTKGAPDEVLKKCTHIFLEGEVFPLTNELRVEVLDANKNMADQALRVLGAAMRKYDELPNSFEAEDLEQNLIFIGLTGMIDPIRPEVVDAIATCGDAGIKPIMITGDHKDTAVAIAKQLGIITSEKEALTGTQLNEISDADFFDQIENYSVYARVQPEHKVRIVNTWKAKGKVTAMTGDGVNDAPSIKSADIGIGMGITGTDVTKNVADMVLADDNFATIVHAVEEGRRIYDNIRKAIQFLLSSNLSEVLSIFTATMLNFTILRPVHILWINLITDCFPALALGMEKAEGDVMKKKPRDPKAGIFADGMGVDVVYQGILVTILTIAAYFIGHFMESGVWEITESPDGVTMAFLTMSMTEIFHSFNMRSQRNSIFSLKSHNLWLYGAMVLSLILTSLVIWIKPIANAFQFESISIQEYSVAMGLSILIIPIVEIVKFFQRKFSKNR